MNNVIARKITLTSEYRPLSSKSEVCTFELSALPTNAQTAYLRGDDGSDIPWQPGEYHTFHSVDLSQIFVRGAAGDAMTVMGGTW